MIKYKGFIIAGVVCALFSTNIYSQNAIASPYSRYGVGEVTARGFGQNFAMGGTTISMQNDSLPYFFINNANPASYSTIRLTAADLGASYNRIQLNSNSQKSTVNTASFSHVTMAFPLKKWCGAAIGLVPYSSVGYKVADEKELPNIGEVDYLYEGSGGYNQAFLGFGFKPFYMHARNFSKSEKYAKLKAEKKDTLIYKIKKRRKAFQDISMGANVSYLFGGIDNTRRTIFPFSANFFNTRTSTSTRISDIYLDYGMQYAYTIDSLKGRDLKDNVKIMFGATYSANTDMNVSIDSLSVNYFNNSSGTEIVRDTIEFVENTKGSITFPMTLGFGFGIKKGDRLLVAADFAMQNWSSYRVFNQSQGLKNSMRVSLGMQYVPNSKSVGKGDYYKRLHYRAGVRYAQTALELKSTQLSEYAVSVGVGFPVGRNYLMQNFSMVNIGVEFGQRGTTEQGLIKENFIKATVGFTINDRWFVKPKFD